MAHLRHGGTRPAVDPGRRSVGKHHICRTAGHGPDPLRFHRPPPLRPTEACVVVVAERQKSKSLEREQLLAGPAPDGTFVRLAGRRRILGNEPPQDHGRATGPRHVELVDERLEPHGVLEGVGVEGELCNPGPGIGHDRTRSDNEAAPQL